MDVCVCSRVGTRVEGTDLRDQSVLRLVDQGLHVGVGLLIAHLQVEAAVATGE